MRRNFLLLVWLLLSIGRLSAATRWNLGALDGGKTYPTTISFKNASCPGQHTLEILVENAPWFTAEQRRIDNVASGETRTVPATVDLRGVAPGEHRGRIRVWCATCPASVCSQNISEFLVTVVVRPPATVPQAEPARNARPQAVAGEGIAAPMPARAAVVLQLSPEVFEALERLRAGATTSDLASLRGGDESVRRLFAGFPASGSPVAFCRDLAVVLSRRNECVAVDRKAIDAGSYDPDASRTAGSSLAPRVNPSRVCGVGRHRVTLEVTDASGRASSCDAVVRTCAPGTAATTCREGLRTEMVGTPSCDGTITCRWIATAAAEPVFAATSQRMLFFAKNGDLVQNIESYSFDQTPGFVNGFYATEGVGPYRFLQTRRVGNDFTPPYEQNLRATGTRIDRANVVCFDSKRQKCFPECMSTVHIEGFYASEVEVDTAFSEFGDIAGRRVEALALDEAELRVNGQAVFAKGIKAQTGNELRLTQVFQYTIGGAISDRLSTNASVTFGKQEQIVDKTGRRDAALQVYGATNVSCPMIAILNSAGSAMIDARKATSAHATAGTEGWGVWWIGESTCPNAGVTGGGLFYGSEKATRFMRARHAELAKILGYDR